MQSIEGHSSTKFYTADEGSYGELADLWEASVRETHTSLSPEEIAASKQDVRERYLPASKVDYMRDDEGALSGFVAVAADKMEMLFVLPKYIGKGIGKRLFRHAVFEMKARRFDVNERNESAVSFYLRQGCKVVGRSAVDDRGRPFPILRMECSFAG